MVKLAEAEERDSPRRAPIRAPSYGNRDAKAMVG
jgi:hypothetical protein